MLDTLKNFCLFKVKTNSILSIKISPKLEDDICNTLSEKVKFRIYKEPYKSM